MSGWTSSAAGVVRWWTAVYTTGLAPAVRESRRAEIASDVWEQCADASSGRETTVGKAIGVVSRMVRGAPADVLWRANVEGPKMDINIPFQRVTGVLLLALVALGLTTAGISGYDTGREGFESELYRLADQGSAAENGNAIIRVVTGLALIGAAAGFYVSLHKRSPVLATIAAFGLLAGAVLELAASGLQIVFVDLANDYVEASLDDKPGLVVNARTVAMITQQITGAASFALLASTYTLAVLTGREALVPRWLIGIPILGAGIVLTALIAHMFSLPLGDNWFYFMAGVLCSVLWAVIAGLWLIVSPPKDEPAPERLQGAAA